MRGVQRGLLQCRWVHLVPAVSQRPDSDQGRLDLRSPTLSNGNGVSLCLSNLHAGGERER